MSRNEDVNISIVLRTHPLAKVPPAEPVNVSLLDELLAQLHRQVGPPATAPIPVCPEPEPQAKPIWARSAAPARNVQERLRKLNPSEQRKVAMTGRQVERVALERMYGKAVWETLLQNPRLTPPEAARIARMPALPQPLIERITNNRAWLSSAQVRRALLSNHRLSRNLVLVVLRATPKSELRLMPKQLAYPALVRDLASKMKS